MEPSCTPQCRPPKRPLLKNSLPTGYLSYTRETRTSSSLSARLCGRRSPPRSRALCCRKDPRILQRLSVGAFWSRSQTQRLVDANWLQARLECSKIKYVCLWKLDFLFSLANLTKIIEVSSLASSRQMNKIVFWCNFGEHSTLGQQTNV